MRINSITPHIYFCAKNQNSKYNHKEKTAAKPINNGLTTAGAWFSFGVGLDFLSRKISFSKSPFKNSLAVNGIISAAAGTAAGVSSLKKKNN